MAIAVLTGLAFFIGNQISKRVFKKGHKSRFNIALSLLIGYSVIAAFFLIFYVIPRNVSDSRAERKRQYCAKQAGLSGPIIDNYGEATAESELIYRICLE